MKVRTCVSPEGYFVYGVHRPAFTVKNLRRNDHFSMLGIQTDENGAAYMNHGNFPEGDVVESAADWIYEIPNPFPFRGATFIARSWAEAKAKNPAAIRLPLPPPVSFTDYCKKQTGDSELSEQKRRKIFSELPEALLLAIAETSTDPEDLTAIAALCCDFVYDKEGTKPVGIQYRKQKDGRRKAVIHLHDVFEVLVNNINLPDIYKEVMVLRPGVQGSSEIVGEWNGEGDDAHVFEYLRRNSYIPWGHYAANMANDAIRYGIQVLSLDDMIGLRHLYYQRNYVRMAQELGIEIPGERDTIAAEKLEAIRMAVREKLMHKGVRESLHFNASLWGWNYGFDFAPSKYRLHASHQQIHQQFAMVPAKAQEEQSIDGREAESQRFSTYCCGDLVHDVIAAYHAETGQSFFVDYERAIRSNCRMDGNRHLASSLIVFEDGNVMLFVPKAQTSQWELQLMTIGPVGNIMEADATVRRSLDRAIWVAMRVLTGIGARMITTIEYSKRFDVSDTDQRLLYSFLPKLPESPGAFSEAQLRWINGHYPEDFAAACRAKVPEW
jgi:hypothetical protein